MNAHLVRFSIMFAWMTFCAWIACACLGPKGAVDIATLTAKNVACIVEHPGLPVQTYLTVCSIPQDLATIVQDLISGRAVAVSMPRPDGGTR